MSYTMLSGQTVYKQGISKGEGFWKDGVFYKGEDTVTYEPLANTFVEPMEKEETDILPEGFRTNDARWLLCDHVLNSYRENSDDASLADRIYLRNPEEGKKAQAFLVYAIEEWETNEDMTLIDSGFNYILVKEGKLS